MGFEDDMAISESIQPGAVAKNGRDVFFAIGIVIILAVLFLPIRPFSSTSASPSRSRFRC